MLRVQYFSIVISIYAETLNSFNGDGGGGSGGDVESPFRIWMAAKFNWNSGQFKFV